MSVNSSSNAPVTPQVPAMVLAAGRGERMRPLTDHTPKPLLPVRGQPLMQWTLEAMARAGITQVVVNTGWLGTQIPAHFSSDNPVLSRLPALHFSNEVDDFGHALETAGGIARALPWLQSADARGMFWLAAGDVHAPTFGFPSAAVQALADSDVLAHLWLVPNPPHNPRGDFILHPDGRLLADDHPEAARHPRHTYSTMGLFKCEMFKAPWSDIPEGNPAGLGAPLAPLLRKAISAGKVRGALFTGAWTDVGTPERLAALETGQP